MLYISIPMFRSSFTKQIYGNERVERRYIWVHCLRGAVDTASRPMAQFAGEVAHFKAVCIYIKGVCTPRQCACRGMVEGTGKVDNQSIQVEFLTASREMYVWTSDKADYIAPGNAHIMQKE